MPQGGELRELRVCIVTPVATVVDGGGVATHVRELAAGLARLGHDVTILSGRKPSDESQEPPPHGARLAWVTGAPGDTFDPRFWAASRGVFEDLHSRSPFDVVVSEGSTAAGLLDLPGRPPLVSHMHQFKFVHLVNSALEIDGPRTLAIYALKTVPKVLRDALTRERPFLERCAGIACGAEHMRAQLCRWYRLAPERVRVLPYWIDVQAFRPDPALRAGARRRWGLPEGAFVVLILGRLQATKGVDVGLRAFAAAFPGREDARLVVAGTGEARLEEELRRTAADLGISSRVVFAGGVRAGDGPSMYGLADLFVMPSRLIEVLPYTILEAMAAGLPVVAADRPGSAEALGGCGVLVPVGDAAALASAMGAMSEDGERRRGLGERARARAASSYSESAVASRYAAWLEEAAARGPARR